MKKLALILAVAVVAMMAKGVSAAPDKEIIVTGSFGTAVFELYATDTSTVPITEITLATAGKLFPTVEADCDSKYIAGQAYMKVSAGTATNWTIHTYTENNIIGPDCDGLRHELDPTKKILMKYRNEAFAGSRSTLVVGDNIDGTVWGDTNSMKWFVNEIGGVAAMDSGEVGYSKVVAAGEFNFDNRIQILLPINTAGQNVPGKYSTTIAYEMVTN